MSLKGLKKQPPVKKRQEAPEEAEEEPQDITETIMIEGMTCSSCEKRINHSVSKMHGVKKMQRRLAIRLCREVEFNLKKQARQKIIEKEEH